jgi:hypothetical protein
MALQLRKISRDNLFECIGLTTSADQKRFVATKGIKISYESENRTAERLYAQLGFRPTGEIEEGEIIAQLQTEP